MALKRTGEALPRLERAQARVTNDPEVRYYLGLALAAQGRDAKARAEWEGAQILAPFRPAARLELARLDAREGDLAGALSHVRGALEDSADAVRAGGLEVALLRRLGRADEAQRRLAAWRALDPTNGFLRHEAVKLGADEAGLWAHLAGDPERVLDVVEDYMGLGFLDDAIELLDRRYPTGEGVLPEPGTAAPQDYPLVAYYRGYCRERRGGSGAKDYETASAQSTRYVFPSRASTEAVLRAALRANPDDATARFLLGSLLLSGGRAEDAIAEWQETRRLDPKRLVLHRNLGLTLLHARDDVAGALALFQEGLDVDRDNVALYVGADQALSRLGRPAAEHVAMIERYPDRKALPPVLVEKLALALTESDRASEAETLFADRFFPREENGTNVRQVYLEVRLRRALALARAGRGGEAAAIVESLEQPVPALSFTRDGMKAFVDGVRAQYLIGEIYSAAGRPADARVHWERATRGQDWPNVKPVFAYLAARRLGAADDAAQKRELEASLERSREFLARGTAFPGIATYAQALHLRALGREAEAQERLRQVFLLPDLRLSHFLARRALEGHDPL